MKTAQETLDRIEVVKSSGDIFGVQSGDLFEYLPFDQARSFLKEEYRSEDHRVEWEAAQKENTSESILAEMRGYMAFALGKAENHRGLSAARSLDHYRAWVWFLGDQELLDFLDNDSNYPQYGVPALKSVGEKYDFPLPSREEWFINMSEGRSCGGDEGCNEGCGY